MFLYLNIVIFYGHLTAHYYELLLLLEKLMKITNLKKSISYLLIRLIF